MRYILTNIVALLFLYTPTQGQVIIVGPRPVPPPRAVGILLPPVLPATSPGGLARPMPRVVINPLWHVGGYLPWYPIWEQPTPTVANQFLPMPIPTPAPLTSPPLPPTSKRFDTKARLQLSVPSGSEIWLNGKKLDITSSTVLESPTLQAGEEYTFNIKVVWQEDGRREERTRAVVVVVGEQKSLAYITSK